MTGTSNFSKARTLAFSIAALSLASGCAAQHHARIKVGGEDVTESEWKWDSDKVRTSAAFELTCPKENLELVPLDVRLSPNTDYLLAVKIGVTGCGHKAVYVRPDYSHDWILNSSDHSAK